MKMLPKTVRHAAELRIELLGFLSFIALNRSFVIEQNATILGRVVFCFVTFIMHAIAWYTFQQLTFSEGHAMTNRLEEVLSVQFHDHLLWAKEPNMCPVVLVVDERGRVDCILCRDVEEGIARSRVFT